jgi:hypothetical protein
MTDKIVRNTDALDLRKRDFVAPDRVALTTGSFAGIEQPVPHGHRLGVHRSIAVFRSSTAPVSCRRDDILIMQRESTLTWIKHSWFRLAFLPGQ